VITTVPYPCLTSQAKRVVLSHLNDHIEGHHLTSDHQWGFRTGRSTETLLLHMTEKWNKALDQGKVVGVVFVDFKEAFDCIPDSVLLKKLQASGISGGLYDILQDYLKERKQFTIVNSSESSHATTSSGAPQGSLLGPTLFSIDANDLPNCIEQGNGHVC